MLNVCAVFGTVSKHRQGSISILEYTVRCFSAWNLLEYTVRCFSVLSILEYTMLCHLLYNVQRMSRATVLRAPACGYLLSVVMLEFLSHYSAIFMCMASSSANRTTFSSSNWPLSSSPAVHWRQHTSMH